MHATLHYLTIISNSTDNAAQKSKTTLTLQLLDVNDNPPQLAMDYTNFFCHPLSGGEKALIQATDADEQHYYSTFTFSLADDMNTRNSWEISKVNGKLIKLLLQ